MEKPFRRVSYGGKRKILQNGRNFNKLSKLNMTTYTSQQCLIFNSADKGQVEP